MSEEIKPAEDGGSFSSKVINIVFVTLLLDLLGFTLILPLLPSILDHYAHTQVGLLHFIKEIIFLFKDDSDSLTSSFELHLIPCKLEA